MNKDIELILFDLGGVLVMPTGVDTMIEWTGKTVEELWTLWLSSKSVRDFESGRTGKDQFAEDVLKEFSISVSEDTFLKEFKLWANTLYPGASDLMTKLSQKRMTASLSNTNEIHWKILTKELKIDTFFHHNFPSHITGFLKPDNDPFLNVSESLNIEPSKILFFDDNLPNIKTAEKLGFYACHVRGIEAVEKVLLKEKLL